MHSRIHTRPLDIVLNPWNFEDRFIFCENILNPLSLGYYFKSKHLEKQFKSIEQFILYKLCLHHAEYEKAKEILYCTLFQARNLTLSVIPHESWYESGKSYICDKQPLKG